MADLIDAKFYALMGKAVSQWAAIDRLVFDIFRIALGTDERRALVCYQTKSGVGSRMGLTGGLLAIVEPEFATQFKGIQKEAGRLLESRNLMAHGRPALNIMEAISGIEGTGKFDDYVEVFHSLPVGQDKTRLRRGEIAEHIRAVGKLEAQLEEFTRGLSMAVDRTRRERMAGGEAAEEVAIVPFPAS